MFRTVVNVLREGLLELLLSLRSRLLLVLARRNPFLERAMAQVEQYRQLASVQALKKAVATATQRDPSELDVYWQADRLMARDGTFMLGVTAYVSSDTGIRHGKVFFPLQPNPEIWVPHLGKQEWRNAFDASVFLTFDAYEENLTHLLKRMGYG